MEEASIPFRPPTEYFTDALGSDGNRINEFPEIQKKHPEWLLFDNDLHVYPYTHAVPAMLSMGCNNKCSFCPTAELHKGIIHYGDPEIILPYYKNTNVHFMDENFFRNDMDKILPLLRRFNIRWLAMSTYKETMRVYEEYGEDYLFECGLRAVEVGLENISLYRKVKGEGIPNNRVEICYMNMTFLPNETVDTIQETANWMKRHSLKRPIHYTNGVWYSGGQFYYPYKKEHNDGILLKPDMVRTRPSYVPDSFLNQTVRVVNLELINFFCQLSYDFKLYPAESELNIREFVGCDYRKAMWLVVGIRTGGLV